MPKRINIEFSTKEREEYKAIVLEKLKEGEVYDNIAESIGISNKTVRDMRDVLIEEGKITQSEIDRIKEEKRKNNKAQRENEDAQKVLEGLRKGKSQRKIAEELEFSPMKVNRLIKELIEKGEITREEIEKCSQKNLKKREMEDNIYKMLKEGRTYEYIKSELKIADRTIYVTKKRLVEEGRLTEEEANPERSRKNKISTEQSSDNSKFNDETEKLNEELKEQVLNLLLKGVNPWKIRRKLDIDAIILNKIKKELITKGRITADQMRTAKINRRNNDREKVYRFLIQGYPESEIADRMDEVKEYIADLVRELKEAGKITDKEIQEYKYKRNKKPFLDHVLMGLREGFTYQEIADNDENGYLTKALVKNYKEELVATDAITEEEIEFARKRRNLQRKRQRKIDEIGEYDEKILDLFELGFLQSEICTILELSDDYVRSRKKILFLRKQLSQEKINNAKKNRESNAEKRKQKIKAEIDESKKRNPKNTELQIKYCKALLKLGKLGEEDLRFLNIVVRYMPEEYMTIPNINLVVRGYIKLGNVHGASEFISKCIHEVDDGSKILEKLEKIKSEISYYEKKKNASRLLRNENLSIEDIAAISGISTIDVIRIMKAQNQDEEKKDNMNTTSINKEKNDGNR